MNLGAERLEFNQFKEMHMPNYHITCNMPGPEQFAALERQATDRFNTLLEISQEEAARNSGNSRDLLAARLRTRFNEGPCSYFDIIFLIFLEFFKIIFFPKFLDISEFFFFFFLLLKNL